jgi:hypothetical protein
LEKGGGVGVWEVEGGRWRMETGEKMGEESNRSHVAGSGEAEDVGVARCTQRYAEWQLFDVYTVLGRLVILYLVFTSEKCIKYLLNYIPFFLHPIVSLLYPPLLVADLGVGRRSEAVGKYSEVT